jgi:hypothetical protein
MAKMLSMCGLDCAACPAFIAHKTDDQALREKTAAEWSQQFHIAVKPADINDVLVQRKLDNYYRRPSE